MTKSFNRQFGRVLSLILSVAMLVTGLPVDLFGGIASVKATGTGTTYTLLSSSLDEFATGTKADGASQSAGTSDYFTVIYSTNSRVDTSGKTWAAETFSGDAYTPANNRRINFGGTASTGKNAVKFHAKKGSLVKVWWVEGGTNHREMVILDSTGTEVKVSTEGASASSNEPKVTSFSALEAEGDYYLGAKTGNNYIFKVEVTEPAATGPQPFNLTYDLTDEALVLKGTTNGGETIYSDDDVLKLEANGTGYQYSDGHGASLKGSGDNHNTITINVGDGNTISEVELGGCQYSAPQNGTETDGSKYATVALSGTGLTIPDGATKDGDDKWVKRTYTATDGGAIKYAITDNNVQTLTLTFSGQSYIHYIKVSGIGTEPEVKRVPVSVTVADEKNLLADTGNEGVTIKLVNAEDGTNAFDITSATSAKTFKLNKSATYNIVVSDETNLTAKSGSKKTITTGTSSSTAEVTVVPTKVKATVTIKDDNTLLGTGDKIKLYEEGTETADGQDITPGGNFTLKANTTYNLWSSKTDVLATIDDKTVVKTLEADLTLNVVVVATAKTVPVTITDEGSLLGTTDTVTLVNDDDATDIVTLTNGENASLKFGATYKVASSNAAAVVKVNGGKTVTADSNLTAIEVVVTAAATDYFEIELDQDMTSKDDPRDTTGNTKLPGLKAGKTYDGGISVLEDMPVVLKSDNSALDPITIGSTTYPFGIQGATNPQVNSTTKLTKDKDGEVAGFGAVLVLDAQKDGVLSIAVATKEKVLHFVDSSDDNKEYLGGLDANKATDYPAAKVYKFNVKQNHKYYFYAYGSKVKIAAITVDYRDTSSRKAWSEVAAPVIKSVAAKADDKNKIDITVDGVVDINGADALSVDVIAENGDVVKTLTSENNGTSHTLTYDLTASGKYTFKAYLSRENEETKKESTVWGPDTFNLVLETPVVAEPVNVGGGDVTVSWKEVKEATGYEITYYVKDAKPATFGEATADNGIVTVAKAADGSVPLTDMLSLTADKTYVIEVRALREGTGEGGTTERSEAGSQEILVKASADTKTYYTLETGDLSTFAAGTKQDGDTEKAGTKQEGAGEAVKDDYFTLIYSAKTKLEAKKKEFTDGYESINRVNFGDAASVAKNVIMFTIDTKTVADVVVWWTAGAAGREIGLLDSDGNVVVQTSDATVKDGTYVTTWGEMESGTYYLGGIGANSYFHKVQVIDYGEAGKGPRADWSTVEKPAVDVAGIVYDEDTTSKARNGKIKVPVNARVGYNGADEITVTMYDANGVEVDKVTSKANNPKVIFKPEKSGNYTFKGVLSREGETDIVGDMSEAFAYNLPLETPSPHAFNNGGGAVTVAWDEVKEATSYEVIYYVTADNKPEAITESSDKSKSGKIVLKKDGDTAPAARTKIEGLTLGTEYSFEVTAFREDASVPEDKVNEIGWGVSSFGKVAYTIEDKIEREWVFAAFGASTSVNKAALDDPTKSANGYDGNANKGSVQVWSTGGKGKIVPASTDGIAFYYTKLDPIKNNFVLKAKVHVDKWKLSNGQDGFGLMVSDRVGVNGDETDPFWNNSYMAVATKIEYRWNREANELTQDSEVAANTSMKLGIGSIARTGAPAGWTSATLPQGFTSTMNTLEYSCGKAYGSGTYNIIGNYELDDKGNAPGGDQGAKDVTDWYFTLERSNTGYKITYTSADGSYSESKMYYDEKYFENGVYTGTYKAPGKKGTLAQMDEDGMYVGFFASRNATVTFSEIDLKVTDAATDPAAEERVKELIDPSYSIASASNANSADYDLQFYSNVPGYLTITAADGSYVANNYRIAEENIKVHFPVKLKYGSNSFTWTMTPDKDYELGGEGTNKFLKDYNVRSDVFTVTYNTFGNKYIYVTPDAASNGAGTEESPVDIATAVKYISAGQTILLGGGTYKLTSSLTISAGINGTKKNPIRMIANPSAKERPVIDFGKNYKAGMTLSGDYWILQGFDVTNSGDSTDGLHVTGSYNVVDSVNTYRNGNTGIQISRKSATDATIKDWPSYNTIKNCTSYLNADAGYEDADGFAAKLTCGPGNVFDGCIAAYNADDGWDLYAKIETGSIGVVTIKNCVAYGNGYVFDDNGNKLLAGNGNGFKLGGASISGYHKLINSVAFNNKAKGIDSNSCPDVQVENCTSFNNGSSNVALYTGAANENTDYSAMGVLSYRSETHSALTKIDVYGKDTSDSAPYDVKEKIELKGKQDKTKVYNATSYYWDESAHVSQNTQKAKAADDWFVSLDFDSFSHGLNIIGRNADGTINLGDFLKLTDKAPEGVGARDLDKLGAKSDKLTADVLRQEKATLLAAGMQITAIDDQQYTGKAIKPALRVSDGLVYLTKKDYTVTYKNNVNVGTATVIIKGKGNYSDKVETTFKITPKDISDDDVTLKNEQMAVVGNGKAKNASVSLLWGKKKLGKKDFSVSYQQNGKSATPSAVGSYDVIIKGTGNYTGTKEAVFKITDKAHMISKAKLSKIKVQTATGNPITFKFKPATSDGDDLTTTDGADVTVKMGSTTLKPGKDYEFDYVNNVNPGKATLIVRGRGDYAGEKQVKFTIQGVKINKATVTGIPKTVEYSGQAVTLSGVTLKLGGKTLVTGTDYSVSYKKNNKAGTAQIIFTGKGMYTGTLKKSFKIVAHNITGDLYTYDGKDTKDGKDSTHSGTDAGKDKKYKGHIIVEGLSTYYQKGGAKLTDLQLKYYDSESQKITYLKEKTDYTISYKNNNQVYTSTTMTKKSPYITIKGKGTFKGTMKLGFVIYPQELDATRTVLGAEQTLALIAPDVIAGTKMSSWANKLVVKDLNGKKLTGKGKKADYTVTYTVDGQKITSTPAAGTVITATITKGASGLYVGENSVEIKVIAKDKNVKKAKVKQTAPIYYTGEAITLEDLYADDAAHFPLTVTVGGATLKYDQDYEVVEGSYLKNVKKGTAKVTIRGIGQYGGTKTISFKISAKPLKKGTASTTDGTDDGKDTKDGKDKK